FSVGCTAESSPPFRGESMEPRAAAGRVIPSHAVSLRRPTRRQWRIGLAAVGVTALAVVAQRWGWVGSGGSGGLGNSEPAWIWVDADPRDVRPRVFLAVRDFELERVPSNATARV